MSHLESLKSAPLETAEEIVNGPGPVLRDVHFYKIRAELAEEGNEFTSHNDGFPSSDEESAPDIEVGIGLRTRQSAEVLGVRVHFTARTDLWKVSLDVAAEFVAESAFETTNAARTDFADKVGIMTLFPYIRETVASMTQRTYGASVVLPTIRNGEISFLERAE